MTVLKDLENMVSFGFAAEAEQIARELYDDVAAEVRGTGRPKPSDRVRDAWRNHARAAFLREQGPPLRPMRDYNAIEIRRRAWEKAFAWSLQAARIDRGEAGGGR